MMRPTNSMTDTGTKPTAGQERPAGIQEFLEAVMKSSSGLVMHKCARRRYAVVPRNGRSNRQFIW
ncbi:hypothetical protein GQ55_3G431100 [Panicum hallii var. hallii]|uniref:Uncharacterized protein n=1 Tax=Panicum hallii var. hallii TaxID=1504633 RepID=A0A2T7EHT8_9POAL|nr:hypothetical protein GQ55_3G431100 [Panicum hallii var. hallii]